MQSARAFFAVLACFAAAAPPVLAQQPAADAPKANFERLCGTCHEPERSTSSRRTREQWLQTVNGMVARGAEGTDAELMGVVEYLTREYGRVNVNLASAEDLARVLGLTPAEAAAIVQARRERGTFEDAAAVARVPGVDATKLAARNDAMVFGSRVAPSAGRVPVAALTAYNNWPGVNGGPQREGWARPEAMLARNTAAAIQLLYTRKLDNRNRGTNALTPPLVLGNLISYRGFKEMLLLGGSSDVVYSIDAALNRVLWTAKLPVQPQAGVAGNPDTCPGGLMGIVMNGSAASGFGAPAGIRRPGVPPPGFAPPVVSKDPVVMGLAGGFGRNGLVVAVGSDGRAYPLSQSNGALVGQPIPFVPASSNVRSANLFDYTLYATNRPGCGEDAVYALDLASDNKAVVKVTSAGRIHGSAGPAIGNDGTVYVHAGDRIIALTAKTLKEKDYFSIPAPVSTGMTPLVFQHNGKDIVVAGAGSEVYLLDSGALGGQDHSTPFARARVEGAVRAAFAGWEDPETRTRWIYVPVSGADSASGGIAAFTLEERDGRLTLVPRWTSRGMVAPAAPVIANGLVFALSTGGKSNAKLSVLDAASGKELFTSRDTVTGAANPDTGLAVANGQVYFSTQDNTVYCFGIPTEH